MATRKTEEQMESSESGNLIAASKVEGTPVMNTAGEKLGSIENVMIDKLTIWGRGRGRVELPVDTPLHQHRLLRD